MPSITSMKRDISANRQEIYTLEGLHSRPHDELQAIFSAAPEPNTIEGLHGDPFCLGLALGPALTFLDIGPLSFVGRYVSRKAIEPDFPWGGKSFRAQSPTSGTGINRFRMWGIRAAFPFRVGLGTSVLDGRKCITIDYDFDENPAFERPTYDELREVSPGIFMGPAMSRTGNGHRLLAWFGADTSRQVKTPFQG